MIILAQDNSENVIVKMSVAELANLLGFHSDYDDKFRSLANNGSRGAHGLIGKELKIHDLFKGYSTLKELAKKKKDILKSITDLEEAVKAVHEIKLVEPKTTEPK